MSRTALTVTSIGLPPEEFEAITEKAKAAGMKRSKYIRLLVARDLGETVRLVDHARLDKARSELEEALGEIKAWVAVAEAQVAALRGEA